MIYIPLHWTVLPVTTLYHSTEQPPQRFILHTASGIPRQKILTYNIMVNKKNTVFSLDTKSGTSVQRRRYTSCDSNDEQIYRTRAVDIYHMI